MATHSSILTWRIPWTQEPGRLKSMGSQESNTTERLSTQHTLSWERLKVEEKGMTEDEMVEWHHQLDGHEFE